MPRSLFDRFYVCLATVIALSAASACQAERPANFGRQWVRQNPFSIMGLVQGTTTSFDPAVYTNAGFNVVFSNQSYSVATTAGNAGLPWQVHTWGDPNSPAGMPYESFLNLPGSRGVLFWDEPKEQNMSDASVIASWLRNTHPDKLIYANALPIFVYGDGSQNGSGYSYNDYLEDFASLVKSDVLMFDMYPLYSNGTTGTHTWFNNLMAVRNKALEHNLPYWGWMQSFLDPGQAYRTPSESDNRYNAFTLLTAGYTGLNYYFYDNLDAYKGTFLDANGNPTPFYHYAAEAHAEIAQVGQSLRMLTSTDVRIVPGTVPDYPNSIGTWSAGAGDDPHLLNAAVNTAAPSGQGPSKDGLIGFFTDADGQHYFMLTNLNHGMDMSAEDASLSFILTFDSGVESIWRLNRITGLAEEIELSNHMLHLTLPGGTGDLFKYDNGLFTGTTVPEPASHLILGVLGLAGLLRRRNLTGVFGESFATS